LTKEKTGQEKMRNKIDRRDLLMIAAGGLAAVQLTRNGSLMHSAWSEDRLTIVEWGHYVDTMKQAFQASGGADANWVHHEGGSAAILAKIKTSWPNPPYDLIGAWKPVFLSMAREGWIEKVTIDDVPNLKDVPERLIDKDESGNWISVPRALTAAVFAYRTDLCPIEITKLTDLLDPRLKGQIAWPNPVTNTNLQVAALALANGGHENNMEPGWTMLKELAKRGNIGRVYGKTSEGINSLTTGETSVTFMDCGSLNQVAKKVPVKFLSKVHGSLKTFPWAIGWCILKSSTAKKAAFDFANYTISPDVNTMLGTAYGEGPTNVKSAPVRGLEHLSFNEEQLARFAHFADYDRLSKDMDAAVKRFEQEIQPLL
jgi:putative spermidine/putrescine transport system substrate-binding protein